MYVTYLSNFSSLQRTREAYYEQARFADVFASLTRAPSRLEDRIGAISGVSSVETRVVADVTLDVPGMAAPALGRLISVPALDAPRLNGVYLRRGRWIDAARPDEVLASEMFCEEHGLEPGDRVWAVINGRRRPLTIVGVAPLAGVRVRHPARGDLSGPTALRHLLDGASRTGFCFQHGRRVQRRFDGARAGRVGPGRGRRAGPADRAVRREGRRAAIVTGIGVDARERAGAARDVWFLGAAHFLRRRGVRPPRGPHARARAAALADRGDEGARILERSARVALHEVGTGHRRGRRDRGRRRRSLAWRRDDRPLQRVFPVSSAELPSVGRRGRGFARREPRCRGFGRADRGAPRRPRAAGRSDAPRIAAPLSAQPCRTDFGGVAPGPHAAHGTAQP